MSMIQSDLLLGQEGGAGYAISRSLRFNSSDSAYLSRTPASAGNRKTWTWAGWVKFSGSTATNMALFGVESPYCIFGPGDGIGSLRLEQSGVVNLITTSVVRDYAAWYHVVVTINTTQATAANRAKIYINGTEQSYSTATYPAQNADLTFNSAVANYIGAYAVGARHLSGYLADIHFIDGQALTPSSFGEFSATTGRWEPKAYTGSYGTNGFRLDFSNPVDLGNDAAGTNDWTPNNVSGVSGGPTSVAAASGALPVYNTTDTYGTTKGTGTRTDANSSSIVLALPMDGANNGTTFTDLSATIKGSGTAKTITPVGNAKTSTATSKFYGSSGSFDGAGDYLSLASGADFDFGTGNFTVEWYQFWNSVGYFGTLYDNNYSGTPGLLIQSTLTGTYTVVGGSSFSFTSSTAPAGGSWTHYALVRNGSSVVLYRNGVADGSTSVTGSVGNSTAIPYIGGSPGGGGYYVNSYIQDFRIYKGVAKYTSNFNPPTATQDTALAAGNDSLVDTPVSGSQVDTGLGGQVTGNYATWNPLDKGADVVLANGNLDMSQTNIGSVRATLGVSSGKWYWEIVAGSGNTAIGVSDSAALLTNYLGATAKAVSWAQIGNFFTNGVTLVGGSAPTYTTGNVIGVALNMDAGTVQFYKNNSLISASASGLTGTWFPAIGTNVSATTSTTNFGQRPFAYTAPSGFKALCDTNLPAPTIARPSTVFDTKLYTSNAGTLTVSGLGFSPDLVWLKSRGTAVAHALYDTVRGAGRALKSNTTEAEQYTADGFVSFNSDGFTLGANSSSPQPDINFTNNVARVAWCWDAGASTVTNTAGSISSQVRANPSAGFSVVTYTGTGGAGTIGHGLGIAPSMIILKNRTNASFTWLVYHASRTDGYLPQQNMLYLNTTGVGGTGNNYPWNNTAPTSIVFSIGGGDYGQMTSGNSIVAYCWAPVAGYSAFGSYTGNGSADGPFVYTGFRPRWVMIKASAGGATQWFIYDTARNTSNVGNFALYASDATAETSILLIDLLSNGFKLRYADTGGYTNYAGWTYIYAAFAESPFQYARAR